MINTPEAVPAIDVTVENQGSMFVFQIPTEEAKGWVSDNIQLERWQWLGSGAFAVDGRFAPGLALGMQSEGLEVG